jgi:hypothetical protein
MRNTKNEEGMVWEEWLLATGQGLFDRYGLRQKVRLYPRKLRKAFLAGEDPTEHKKTEMCPDCGEHFTPKRGDQMGCDECEAGVERPLLGHYWDCKCLFHR